MNRLFLQVQCCIHFASERSFIVTGQPCSVVVCTRNRPEELDSCLDALSRLTYSDYDVLVVDNAPQDTRTREVASRWAVRYLLEPVPGLSRARNAGARACSSEMVAFTDDDARPEPGWLSALADEYSDPKVMAVAGRTLALRVETQAQCLFQQLGGFDHGVHSRRVIDSATPGWFEMANFGGVGNGMNMSFRRAAFDLWPGFDSRLGRGAVVAANEEHHAFFSLIDRGYRVVYTPAAVVRHPFPTDWDDFRARQLETLACGFGYLAFLYREEPRYRPELLRFFWRRLRLKAANWRHAPVEYRRILPLWRQIPAMLWSALRCLVNHEHGNDPRGR